MVSPSRCPPWQPERPGPTRREPRRAQRSYTTPRDTILQTPGGGDVLNFIQTEERFEPKAGGLDHFGIHVPESDWSQLPEQLERAGVPIQGRRGEVAIFVEDPNGYTVELYKD